MTPSVHDYSDDSEGDEQEKNSETQAQSSSATGMSHPGISSTNIYYATPPQPGQGHPMIQVAHPYPDPYYRSIFAPCDAQPYPAQPYPAQAYPAQPMVQMQLMGIQQAGVPLPSDAIEEPVFVNAKQYHGILRRRQSRAKAESKKELVKSRKPYLHESRHLHALKRARGCGGRFLNAKKDNDPQNEATSGDNSKSNRKKSNKNGYASSDSTG